jgi:hypothetical protein
MNTGKKGQSRQNDRTRQPYRPPELIVHGDLRALTRSKKGTKSDGVGKPKTRVSLFNA